MKRKHAFIFYFLIGLAATFFLTAVVLGIVLNLDHGALPVINPSGWIAKQERDLLVIATGLMLLVVIPVFILTFGFAWYYREQNTKAAYKPEWGANPLLEFSWWAIPFAIIAILSVITFRETHALDPFKPIENGSKPLEVQVVALDWKWFFIYPEQKIATVNYLQIPENRPIALDITADAPMNSFWIPALGGQMYAMQGMSARLYLLADQAGTFDGASANISGKGFAEMRFKVKASGEEEFEEWVKTVKNTGSPMDNEAYNKIVEPSVADPAAFYVLKDENLFNSIIMKYMKPES